MVTRTFRGTTYDVITATANSQSLTGTPQSDWIEVLGGDNIVNTGPGNDVVLANVGFDYIGNYDPFGGEAIFWSSFKTGGTNKISTGAGDDYVAAASTDDIVDLGAGNDIFDGAGSSNVSGNDIINAGAGNDIVYDRGAGSKTIYGGAGDDILFALGDGDTTIDGGTGDDTISAYSLKYGENEVFTIDGGAGNDFMDVSCIQGTVDGGAGNDSIIAGANKGDVNGGAGNDDIVCFGGRLLQGGSGNDLMFIESSGLDNSANFVVSVLAGSEDDTIVTSYLSELFGQPLSKNEIHGGAGNDIIISGGSDDTIYDEIGDDIINLRGGFVNLMGRADRILVDLFGIDTSNIEVHGGGIDTVYLGAGKDTIALGKGGKAVIHGFTSADRLDLGGLNISVSRNQGDTLISTNDSEHIQLATLVGYSGPVNIV